MNEHEARLRSVINDKIGSGTIRRDLERLLDAALRAARAEGYAQAKTQAARDADVAGDAAEHAGMHDVADALHNRANYIRDMEPAP